MRAFVFRAVGALLSLAALVTSLSVSNFQEHAKRAVGTVVEEVAGPAHVIVRFKTLKGEEISFSQGGFIWLGLGEMVPVLFDESRPQEFATVDRPGALWFTPVILFVLGFMFMMVPWLKR